LVQEVEVADIPCQYAGTDTPRLKIDERIVEVFPLITRTLRHAAETKELARKHSRFALPHANFQTGGRRKSGRVASGSHAIAREHRNYQDRSKTRIG
jgi:hypothetical protein